MIAIRFHGYENSSWVSTMKPLLVAALSVGLFALASVPAAAEIVPQKGIAGTAIGMSEQQVTDLLGQPQDTRRLGEPDVDPGVETEFVYDTGLTVSFVQNMTGVVSVSTTSTTEQTAAGVGVGSTKSQVRRQVKGAHCQRHGPSCFVGRLRVGNTRTEFHLRRHRVNRVSVFIQFP